MKKVLVGISLLLCVVVWTVAITLYVMGRGEQTENVAEESSAEEQALDPMHEELYTYLNNFLFDVVFGEFSTYMAQSIDARLRYTDGLVSLDDTIRQHDELIHEAAQTFATFEMPQFEGLTAYQQQTLAKMEQEIVNIEQAYENQLVGQKGLTFATARTREELANPEGFSEAEQDEMAKEAQRLVDTSLDEILAFELKMDHMAHELMARMGGEPTQLEVTEEKVLYTEAEKRYFKEQTAAHYERMTEQWYDLWQEHWESPTIIPRLSDGGAAYSAQLYTLQEELERMVASYDAVPMAELQSDVIQQLEQVNALYQAGLAKQLEALERTQAALLMSGSDLEMLEEIELLAKKGIGDMNDGNEILYAVSAHYGFTAQ